MLKTQRNAKLIDEYIAHTLNIARISRDLSRSEMARRVGVSRQQIEKYERGINRVSLGRFFDICAALNYEPEGLLPTYMRPPEIKKRITEMKIIINDAGEKHT